MQSNKRPCKQLERMFSSYLNSIQFSRFQGYLKLEILIINLYDDVRNRKKTQKQKFYRIACACGESRIISCGILLFPDRVRSFCVINSMPASRTPIITYLVQIAQKHTALTNTFGTTHRYFHFRQRRLFSSNAASRHYCTLNQYKLITKCTTDSRPQDPRFRSQ